MTENRKSTNGKPSDNRGNGVIRSLEATYWRLLRKRVRADNVLSGARGTFVERWWQNRADEGELVKHKAAVQPERLEGRLPIPLYGVEPQVFRDREVVFTCVVGDRHFLEEAQLDSSYECVLYADRDMTFPRWSQRPLLFWDPSPKMITLFHKYALANLVPDGTKMLWVDPRIVIASQAVDEIFAALDNTDVCLFGHYERDCVYDEILAVLEAGRSATVQCEEYARHLHELAFPRHAGLYETGVIAFRVCPEVRALFRKVFGLCYRYVPCDQLTLPLALASIPTRISIHNGGATHLRNSPGITVGSYKEAPFK